MSDLVKVNVDGVEVEVAPGTTILQAVSYTHLTLPTNGCV